MDNGYHRRGKARRRSSADNKEPIEAGSELNMNRTLKRVALTPAVTLFLIAGRAA